MTSTKLYPALEAELGHTFMDQSLLVEAQTHKSFLAHRPDDGRRHNERLSFLGDAVLGLVVADQLARDLPRPSDPHTREKGPLTDARKSQVNNVRLHKLALTLSLELSFGATSTPAQTEQRSPQASALEAVFGAVYRDTHGSMERTAEVVHRILARSPHA